MTDRSLLTRRNVLRSGAALAIDATGLARSAVAAAYADRPVRVIAPFAAAIDPKGVVAWVSNLGGRPPKPEELFASPAQKPTERVLVDNRGVAASGTVMRIDLDSGRATHTIPVGLHPTALALDEARQRLYVANGNSDSISVIDTVRAQVTRTIPLQPFSQRVRVISTASRRSSRTSSPACDSAGGSKRTMTAFARGDVSAKPSRRCSAQNTPPCATTRTGWSSRSASIIAASTRARNASKLSSCGQGTRSRR